KSIVLAAIQIPLLVLFIIATVGLLRQGDFRSLKGVMVLLIVLHMGVYLVILSMARYSVALVPLMVPFAAAVLSGAAKPARRAAIETTERAEPAMVSDAAVEAE